MMRSVHHHIEHHRTDRIGWLRAAVLGANDGIVSTASLLLGVVAANVSHDYILVTGVARLVTEAMSMATGEFVTVHSQADTEKSDLAREQAELQKNSAAEKLDLATIYVNRGLEPDLTDLVAEKLVEHDAIGAALPLAVAALAPVQFMIHRVSGTALFFLALLWGIAAKVGGANVVMGAWRVTSGACWHWL